MRKPRDFDAELKALEDKARELKTRKIQQLGDLVIVTGADALTNIFTWRDVDELFRLAHFVGCTRPGYEMDPDSVESIPSDRVTIVEIPALAISSTDCRERTARGEPIWYLVPDGVVQYVAKHQLYAKDTA